MKSLAPITFLVLTFLCGCSHTYYVAPGRTVSRGDTLAMSLVNKRLAGRSAVVTTACAREYNARDIRVTPDSCTLLETNQEKRLAFPVGEVQSIRMVNHFTGLVGGLAIGVGGSFLLFGTMALLEPALHTGLAGFGIALYASMLGTLVATVVGGVHGARTEYQFQPETRADTTFTRVSADSVSRNQRR